MSTQKTIDNLELTMNNLIEAYETTTDLEMKKNFYKAVKREYTDYHNYVRNVPKLEAPSYKTITQFVEDNNPFKHYCGESGYDSSRDAPCPGCTERDK